MGLQTQISSAEKQSQSKDPLIQTLDNLHLPSKPVSENDIFEIQSVIQQALQKITLHLEAIQKTTAKNKKVKPEFLDQKSKNLKHQTFVTGLLYFEEWLNSQDCVYQASFTKLKTSRKTAVMILTSYPGQVPFSVKFHSFNGTIIDYRLSVYIGRASLGFAGLSEIEE